MFATIRRLVSTHRNWLLYALVGLSGCGGGGGSSGTPISVPAVTALVAPAYLTADAGVQRVTLNWSAVTPASSFNIYYGNAPGVSKSSAKITDAHSIYVLRNLVNGTPYYFAVATVNGADESALSKEVSATPTPTPPQPAPVSIRADAGNLQVQVSWEPGFLATNAPTSYIVYYGTSAQLAKGGPLKVTAAASPATVTGLSNETPYYFAVTANTSNGESSLSYVASATPQAIPAPLAPTGITTTEGNGTISLRWTASTGASTYNLYYGTEFDVNKASGIKVANISSPFTLSGLSNGKAYFLVISAVGLGGEGFTSPQVAATPIVAAPQLAMMPIPGGSYLMGDNVQDPSAPAPYASPVHQVMLNAFTLSRYETSYTQWRDVYDWAIQHGYSLDSVGRNGALGLGTNMPVTQISWYDTVKWLNARSEKEGRRQVYYTDASHTVVYRSGNIDLVNAAVDWNANGYRLPTDAEWEYASRGGLVGMQYPWGNVLDPSRANYDRGTSTSIGSYPPNDFGLYDMAGNVWEWTWDHDATDYSIDASGVTNPHGPATGLMRTRRGGSYVYGERYLRNFDKMFRSSNYSGPYFGFRAASSQP